VDLAECQNVVSANLGLAPGLGYTVSSGAFTDPVTNITIKQGCAPADIYTIPPHPMTGVAPTLQPVSASVGVCSEIILAIGQSNGGNFGSGRYTASGLTYAYAGSGVFYQASDPMAGGEGSDASPWPRLASLLLGKPHINNPPCTTVTNRVFIANRAKGGTFVADWAPGGSQSTYLIAQVQDMLANGLTPTRIIWVQGEADAGNTTSSAYQASFLAMETSIRNLGVTAPIYIATATVCNFRDAANPSPPAVVWRTPDWYVAKEQARIDIRAAQAALVNGTTRKAGANIDTIDWRLRSLGDGCHGGDGFLWEHARRTVDALTAP
jgi:hypothetical protein